jgi:hypothetical protein
MGYLIIERDINWNGYFDLHCFSIIVPYESGLHTKGAKICLHYGINQFCYCTIVEIKTFYGKNLSEFVARAVIGKDLWTLKTVLHQTYFKQSPTPYAEIEVTNWAFFYVEKESDKIRNGRDKSTERQGNSLPKLFP